MLFLQHFFVLIKHRGRDKTLSHVVLYVSVSCMTYFFSYVVDDKDSVADIGFILWPDDYDGERTHSYAQGVIWSRHRHNLLAWLRLNLSGYQFNSWRMCHYQQISYSIWLYLYFSDTEGLVAYLMLTTNSKNFTFMLNLNSAYFKTEVPVILTSYFKKLDVCQIEMNKLILNNKKQK